MNIHSPITRSFLLILLLTFCGGLYSFGVSPLFILDDEPNLADLEQVKNHYNILEFISQGSAGPLGRPVSLASFALQADAWGNATQFKYVNIAIHLITGLFIYGLLNIIGRLLSWHTEKIFLLSFGSTALWLLSPIQVSTVLYVIQRMAQLSVFFTVIGLFFYLKGREWLSQGKLHQGYWISSLGLIIGGLLALFSKENGVLIILYLWVIEATLLHSLPKPAGWTIWKSIFIYFPVLMVIGYFVLTFQPETAYDTRPFTLVERLLTESRILFDYLGNILVPGYFNQLNLFQDDYIVSKSLFEPPTTIFAVLGLMTAFVSAILLRKRYPIFAFGVLWFLAGHALESTFVPLILYFEHRNYLALLSIVFALIYGFMYLINNERLTVVIRKAILGFVIGWSLLITTATISEVSLWRNPLLQSAHWAEQKPLSRFAQSHAASMYFVLNHPLKALEHYQHMLDVFPDDPAPYTLWLFAACEFEEVPIPDMQLVLGRFARAKDSINVIMGLDKLLEVFSNQKCSRLSPNILESIFSTLISNPNLISNRGFIYIWYANWAANHGDYITAIQRVEESFKHPLAKKDVAKLQKLSWLMQLEQFEVAVKYISQLRTEFSSIENKVHREHLDNMERIATTKLEKATP
jgi:protein O-mannosyl-transferase